MASYPKQTSTQPRCVWVYGRKIKRERESERERERESTCFMCVYDWHLQMQTRIFCCQCFHYHSLSNYILTTHHVFLFFRLKSGIWCDNIFFILRAAPCKNKLNLLLVRFTVCLETWTCLPMGWRTNSWIYVWCVTGGNNAMVHTYDIRQIYYKNIFT